MKRKIFSILFAIVLAASFSLTIDTPAAAATINVPGDYATIQAAINAANPGDTINVAAGTYLGGIQIDKALTLSSTDGADATSIMGVDSNDSYLVRIYHSDVTFEGFTVTNPDYSGGADASGILVGAYLGDPANNVHILKNIVTQVRSESGSPSMYGATGINIGIGPVNNLVIKGNTLTSIHNPDGAPVDHTCGINMWDNANNVEISGNIISDIKYNGILLQYVSDIQLENNQITECQTGLRLEPYEGAAVSNATVTNCTFSDNSGGMYNQNSSPTVTNCIFWGNGGEILNGGTSAPAVTYCDVQGGYGGAGNIDADPLFINPGAGDYHLRPTSPCIDVGNNAAPSLPSTDFEGDPRIVDGNGDGSAVVDMGVDEYVPPPPPVGGELYPVDKFGILAPWLALAMFLALGGGFVVMRRRLAR
jgi:parallel beta-helix repeat protein